MPQEEFRRRSTPEDIANSDRMISVAKEVFDMAGRDPLALTIDEYCQLLLALKANPMVVKDSPEASDKATAQVEFYQYFKSNHECETIGDIVAALKNALVPEDTVSLWVEDGLAINPREYDAIALGYPKLKERLQAVRQSSLSS